MQLTAELASTVGTVAMALGGTSGGHTGSSETVLYMVELESGPKMDSLLETG